MERIILILLATLAFSCMARATELASTSLLIYISPDEYRHESRLGLLPYYIVWARKGPALEQAAKAALQPHFSRVGMCEGSNGADAIVWLKPDLSYNPMVGTYYAKVAARFYRADGKLIGKLKATGTYGGAIGSQLSEDQVRQAYDTAMQDIAHQFAADTALQQAMDPNATKSPCAIVALVPGE